MKNQRIRAIGTVALVALWLVIVGFVWIGADQAVSVSERRPLRQLQEVFEVPDNADEDDDSFIERFDQYARDQFPARELFRKVKSVFHYYALQQRDNNGIYIEDGQAAQLMEKVDQQAVEKATDLFSDVYENLIAGGNGKVYVSVIPDKGYYLAASNGYPSMDYDALIRQVKNQMPWAAYIDILDQLDAASYYRTDHHWRQEELLPVARTLLASMGGWGELPEEVQLTALEQPFYGTYYGQAALPMEPDVMYTAHTQTMEGCTVTGFDKLGKPVQILFYSQQIKANDLYDLFLSGSEQSLVFIENPNAKTERKLVVFRDSYGCSLAPLLADGYAKITLVDLRKLSYSVLERMGVTFDNADVLFLYSTLVLNNPDSFR